MKGLKKSQAFLLTPEKHNAFSSRQNEFASPISPPNFSMPQQDASGQAIFVNRKAFSDVSSARHQKKAGSQTSAQRSLFLLSFKDQMELAQKLSLIEFMESGAEERNLYGLEVYNLPYVAGDCLFVGIQAADMRGRKANDLRALLCERVSKFPYLRTLIENTLKTNNANDRTLRVGTEEVVYESVEEYLKLMSLSGTWARDIEVMMMSVILQRPIAILTSDNMNDLVFEQGGYGSQRAIFLNLVNYGHYQPLYVPGNEDEQEILQQIRNKAFNPRNIFN